MGANESEMPAAVLLSEGDDAVPPAPPHPETVTTDNVSTELVGRDISDNPETHEASRSAEVFSDEIASTYAGPPLNPAPEVANVAQVSEEAPVSEHSSEERGGQHADVRDLQTGYTR